jgi:hypothetical protein
VQTGPVATGGPRAYASTVRTGGEEIATAAEMLAPA